MINGIYYNFIEGTDNFTPFCSPSSNKPL